ncbi:hypothetical protein LSM04_000209 [Trypanosoma melophagium]|uniref:uncharacterized protein n=1 Tax=Trypanosoma melophagium TaxID=715481 RepID=UPI00351A2695|nr:hypothetical protein LSM04_000209 [Trypanosoma melophagium]
MPQGKRQDVQPYTTLLGTKAYILGNVWSEESYEGTANDEMSGAVRHHQLPSLRRQQRSIPVRSRPWRETVRPPHRPQCVEPKGRVVGQSGKRLIKSLDNNIDVGITDELRHFLPTKIVVPPVMDTASSEAPLPGSHSRIPDMPLPLSSNSIKVISSEPLETGSLNAINTTKHPLYDVSTRQMTDLPPDLPKVLAPIAPSNTHRTDVDNNVVYCSMEDHQSMLESGFVYCSQCGMRVSFAPLVEYSPQECPVSHEKLMCDMEGDEGGRKKYCILCGSLINNRIVPLQDNQEKETGNTNSMLSTNLPARIPENVSVNPPCTISGENLRATNPSEPLPSFLTAGNEAKGKKESGNAESHLTVRSVASFPPQTVTEFQTGVANPVLHASDTTASDIKDDGGIEAFTRKKALGSSAMFNAPLPQPATVTEKEETRIDKSMEYPFISLKGTQLKNELGVGVRISTSAGTYMDAAAVKGEFLYTAGLPGVYCGLPNCALCRDSVNSSSPLVTSGWQHSPINEVKRHDEASVVVVHNHYYHKM